MPDDVTVGEVRELRRIAQAALREYGIVGERLSLLAEGKQPAFRVRARPRRDRAVAKDNRYSDNSYLLRIFPDGTRHRAAITSELQWISSILSTTSIVVPRPVASRSGEPVVTVSLPGDERPHHCTLTHWVKGRFYIRKTGPGPGAMWLVGRVMAELHRHGQQFRRGSAFRSPRWDAEGLFGDRSPYFPDAEQEFLPARDRRLYSQVVAQCRAAMDRLGTRKDVFGLVHGDLIQLNYLFYKGTVRVIDFGDFGEAHYLFDMAVTIFALLDLDTDGRQRRTFIEGYREVRSLSDQHEELLDLFLAARGVLLSRFVIGNSGGRLSEPGARYIARVTRGIRAWMNER